MLFGKALETSWMLVTVISDGFNVRTVLESVVREQAHYDRILSRLMDLWMDVAIGGRYL